jgi:hypothetical protein
MTQQRTSGDTSPDRVANGDIVERLRKWSNVVPVPPAADTMQEAANEIERLRNGAVDARETVTLTAEERSAIGRAIATLDGWQRTGGYHSAVDDDAAALRSLLERMT